MGQRVLVLVEGVSDRAAIELLAARRGLELADAGVEVVPIGGAQAIRRVLADAGEARVAGLCDAGEEPIFRRALGAESRAELEALGFFVCDRDLEDELVRALGVDTVERVLAQQGHLRRFRTYQKQDAHRDRPHERQLHGFLHNHKQCCGPALVEALDGRALPRPLAGLLAHVERVSRAAGPAKH
jgi:hypothetical protein